MTVINHKSISGVTSITAPAGSDNLFTVHTNDTTERFRIDASGHQNISGIITAANFKTGTSNLHNTGLNIQDLDVDGHTELDNVNIVGVTTHTGQTRLYGNGGASAVWGNTGYSGHLSFDGSDNAIIRAASGKALIFQSDHANTRMTIGSQGNVSIEKDLDVDGHTNLDNVSIAGISTFTGRIDASDNVAITSGNRLYFGNSDVAYVKGEHGGSGYLVLGANSDHVRLTRNGQIITGGASAISFNNVGNDAFGSFLEVNGTHTIDHHGVLGVSGRTNTNNARVGLIQFLNTENSNSSSTGNAASRSLAHISVYADTSDSNAGDDCGGRIVIGTKGEAAGMNDILFLTSDKKVGIQAIPAVGDLNSTATGGAALSDPKLYVQDGGTNGKYTLMIRCNGGSDADNTGSAIALNHSNDRGILIEGGRWSGNRSWGALKAIDNVGRVTDAIAIRGGNGAGVQDVRIYTGEAVSTTERFRIGSDGKLNTKGNASSVTAGCLSGGIHLVHANAEGTPTFSGGETAIFQRNHTSSQDSHISIVAGSAAKCRINFGDKDDVNAGMLDYENNNNAFVFYTNSSATEKLRIKSDGAISSAVTRQAVSYTALATPTYWSHSATARSDQTIDVSSVFSVPDNAKAILVQGWYHVTGYGSGSGGQGDHASSHFSEYAPSGGNPWSFNTSTATTWGQYVMDHDGDASGPGGSSNMMHYYGMWGGQGIVNVNPNGNIYGRCFWGYSGGTHYNQLWCYGYYM